MTDKDVRKLKRAELLEILFYMEKELEELRQENEELRGRLAGGMIPDGDLERIADAVAAKLNGGGAETEQADAAADQTADETAQENDAEKAEPTEE